MMGAMMDGERLHQTQRKRFWRNLLAVGLAGAPIGFAVGFGAGYSRGDLDAFWNWAPDWLVIGLLGFAIVGFSFGTWRFYRSIDEVELLDNLWSSLAAYYVFALLFPVWWVLGKAGISGEPNYWIIFLAALVLGLATYLFRKWRAR